MTVKNPDSERVIIVPITKYMPTPPNPNLCWQSVKDLFNPGKRKQKADGNKITNGQLLRGRVDSGRTPIDENRTAIVKGHTRLLVQHFHNGEEVTENQREVFDRVITNVGRDAIIDAFTGSFTLSNFNWHDCGTGTVAEAVGDTVLGTPVTEARVEGVQTQPTSDTYRSVATINFTNSYAITEHGLLSQTGKPGGTLLDRTVFSAVNVVSGDAIQFTFEVTIASGG